MKKFLVITLFALVLVGCVNHFGNNPSTNNFEEVEKVDIVINDVVDNDTQNEPETTPQTPITPPANKVEPEVQAPDTSKEETTEPIKKPAETKPVSKPESKPVSNPENKPLTPEKPVTEPPKDTQTAPVSLKGKVICIDAGHGAFTDAINEEIAPGATTKKAGNVVGTKGATYTEDEITLAVANKVKALLEEQGVTVLMTRTDANSTMTNKERAVYANDNKAEIVIKLHADGTQEGGSGMTALVPGNGYIKDSQLLSDSKRLAKAILNKASSLTKAKNRGVYTSSQMTGLNWSKVPVILFEMGFMNNPADEKKLADENYQSLIAQGIVNGILEYYK